MHRLQPHFFWPLSILVNLLHFKHLAPQTPLNASALLLFSCQRRHLPSPPVVWWHGGWEIISGGLMMTTVVRALHRHSFLSLLKKKKSNTNTNAMFCLRLAARRKLAVLGFGLRIPEKSSQYVTIHRCTQQGEAK